MLFAICYAFLLCTHALLNKRDFKQSPEKRERYNALPRYYKFCCWFVVMPMFAGGILIPWLFMFSLVGFFLLEAACIRWYRRRGLFG
ncbi:hypothetical protein ASD58_06415 [Duganella sp. Root1480D1]|nr:hypothetical protein ASD58_06415 [Duganella sp. Root1480D1]KRC00621.1 hypothetical protein ASE26_23180 [Duganella sp. Root198D2]